MMLKRLVKERSLDYYFWRILYVVVKPFSILLSASLLGSDGANLVSLAVIVSTTMMASLSFGTYKALIKSDEDNNVKIFRKSLFLFNCIIIFSISILVFYIEKDYLDSYLFIVLFLITEHVGFDEARIKLYEGNRSSWALENFFRSLFIPVLVLLIYFLGGETYLIPMLLLFFLNILVSRKREGLFSELINSFSTIFSNGDFFKFYFHQINYFITSIMSKLAQQSDRYFFTAFSYETLWVYTIISQIASSVTMIYEMTVLSEMKSKVAKQKNHVWTLFNRNEINLIVISILISLVAFLVAGYFFIDELFHTKFLILFTLLIFSSIIACASMKNSEKMFWHLDSSVKYRNIESLSFIFGHVVFLPVLIGTGSVYLVKLPSVITMSSRVIVSKFFLGSNKE